jgi:CBS domain-containing protein
VYAAEDLFSRLPVHWMWWPAIGGLVIGVGGIVEPHALGVGYDVIGDELTGRIGLGLVVSILLVKTLIWSLSLGSGTSGGVLAPMFMIGGALGALEAQVFPHVGLGFWPLIGLAGVLGGVMRSPFTGVVFAVELTGRFDAVLPLIIGTGVAYGASVLLLRRSVLTEKIARRGYHLSREYDVDPLEALFVEDVLAERLVTLAGVSTVADALHLIDTDPLASNQRLFPVLDEAGRLCGVITQNTLVALAQTPASSVLDQAHREPACAHGTDTLRHAALVMAESGLTRLVVTDRADPDYPIGVVSLQQLLEGRVRDLHEATHSERVIQVPALRPPVLRRRRSTGSRERSCRAAAVNCTTCLKGDGMPHEGLAGDGLAGDGPGGSPVNTPAMAGDVMDGAEQDVASGE